LNLSFKVHGAILTGVHYGDNPTSYLQALETKLNPNIPGYDWSNVVAVEHNPDNGCPAYCPIGTYNKDSFLLSFQSDATKRDPCFCNGIDVTDPTYHFCYCWTNSYGNKANFPCTCISDSNVDASTTWPTSASTAIYTKWQYSVGSSPGPAVAVRATAVKAAPAATEVCRCNHEDLAGKTKETQNLDTERMCYKA